MKTDNDKNSSGKSGNKGLRIATTVILIVAIAFGVLCSYTAFVSKRGDGVPDLFGLRVFSIQSDSMEDTFYEGDLIVDTKVKDPAELKVGDVITFFTVIQGERVLNTHRITEITDNGTYLYFTTQGDNSPDVDPLGVHENEIVGLYRFAIPKVGSVIDFLQTGTGFLVVIVLPVFLFFIYNLVQFFRVFFDYRMKKMRMQLRQEMMRESAQDAAGPIDLPDDDE